MMITTVTLARLAGVMRPGGHENEHDGEHGDGGRGDQRPAGPGQRVGHDVGIGAEPLAAEGVLGETGGHVDRGASRDLEHG
jgi:hypothetical protein